MKKYEIIKNKVGVKCYTDKHISLKEYDGTVFLSLFGVSAEVKSVAASFIEGDRLTIQNDEKTKEISRFTNYYDGNIPFSMMRQKLYAGKRSFLHLIIYAKGLFDNNNLIIATSKDDLDKKIIDNTDIILSRTPIPSNVMHQVVEKFIEPNIYFKDTEGVSTFGIDDLEIAYMPYSDIQRQESAVADFIISQNSAA